MTTRPSREALAAALAEWDAIEGTSTADQFRAFIAAGKMADAILDALPPAEVAEDPSRATADALLVWYDTTHGDELGHDHHCPVTGSNDPETRCTCGWTGVVKADAARGATR